MVDFLSLGNRPRFERAQIGPAEESCFLLALASEEETPTLVVVEIFGLLKFF